MRRNLNIIIILPVIILTVIGILAIWSVQPDHHSQQTGINKLLSYQAMKQFIFAVISFAVFMGLIFVNYYKIRDYTYLIYFLFIGLVLILVAWGKVSHGAKRWFQLGPFALQPSEFLKIAMVLALARMMMYQNKIARLKDFVPPMILAFAGIISVLLQPHLGLAMVLFPTFIIMLFAAGAQTRDMVKMFLIIAIIVPVGYFFVLKDYQRQRVTSFINPTRAPTSEGFQTIQSRVAVGSGGIIGRGWGFTESTGSLFVPERHNDFIFTAISEEWGFLGSSLIVFLYLLIYVSALFIAYNTREPFGRLVVIGIVSYLTIQTFINIGMTVGLAPITGLPLPFVSYGGSSLLSSYIAIGLIVNIGMHQIPSFSSNDF
jgi:rod shape determining protein RodA